MRAFEYARPDTLAGVLELLEQYGSEACILAGGTDLIVRLRAGRVPRIVIDIKSASGLDSGIVEHGPCLRIGALTVMSAIIEDARVQRHFPAVVEAARTVGSVQIRNRATLAGNISNASPAADTAPPLLVYGARINLIGINGRRTVPLTEFFVGPGRTVLNRGEIVESIDLPLPSEPAGSAFGRLTRRRGVDLATVNLSCVVKHSGETIFAFGAVGPRPFLVRADGDPLQSELVFQRMIAQASPISDVRGSREYRLAMLIVLCRRTLQTATGRLQQKA